MKRVILGMCGGLGLALLVACFAPEPALALECSRNKSHNAFIGRRLWNDQLLYSTRLREDGRWLRSASADVYFPNRASQKGNITYVELLDQKRDGSGGCGYIRSGGPGYNHTAMHFKSSGWNEGIDFVVKIFGIPSRR